jgi:hypothetical protein
MVNKPEAIIVNPSRELTDVSAATADVAEGIIS